MNRTKENFSSFLTWFIYGLFTLFILAILIFTMKPPTVEYFPLHMCMMVVGGLLGTFVFYLRIQPESDYETFYNTAVNLSQGQMPSNSRYVALFPHIFGYSSFFNFFFKIFGTSYLVAPIINAALSSLSIFFFYYIGTNMISKTGAIISCLIWTFFTLPKFL